ncbi:RPS24B [Symbiodinium sp. KB8]|nr:RPS24B [Symbiodinium sp. KB8]
MANVSRDDLGAKLAKMYKVHDSKCIQLFSFKTAFGGGRSTGASTEQEKQRFGLIYENLDTKNRMKKTRGKEKSKVPAVPATPVTVHLPGPVPPLPIGGKREGQYATPLPSENLRLASRFYVVVGGGDAQPALYRTFREFNAAVGPLASSQSVSHGFPSELEAKVYVALRPFAELGQVWIYEHASGDGAIESLAVVLAKRPNGLLLAVPLGVIPEEELAVAQEAQMDDLVGSSLVTEAPALAFAPSGFTPVPDQSLSAIVVDLSVQAVPRLSPWTPESSGDMVVPFDLSRPELVPDPAVLLQLALDWAATTGAPERLQYYSAEEGPPEPQQKPKRSVLRVSRDDAPPPAASGLPSGSGLPKPPGPKRVTTATLASQLENLTSTLPSLVRSMEELSERQAAMEKQMAASAQPQLPLMGQPIIAEATVEEAKDELGLPAPSDTLSQAVLEQSRALTTLVAELAGFPGTSSRTPAALLLT